MSNSKVHSLIAEIISSFFVLLFLYTGIDKLIEHNNFYITLSTSPLIQPNARLISWALPVVEIFTAALLFLPRFRKQGLIAALGLMLAFTTYVAYMLHTSAVLPCSCGGVLRQMSWKSHLIFNAGLTLFAVAGLFSFIRSKLFIAINRQSRTPV